MPKRRVPTLGQLNPGDPLLIQSLGKAGPKRPLPRLSADEIAQVSRTVRRVPEVVVKVSGGGGDAGSVRAHVSYIDRHGKLPIETDVGDASPDKDAARELISDWNLDTLPNRSRAPGETGSGTSAAEPPRRRPKAVHNIVLSMPAKVPPETVLAAARVFARENFALQHRYAMVLHTDTRHPHVHLVVKAEREDGTGRLNIYKATLRQWREQFAQALREQGIEANATPAALRGRPASRLKDRIYRAQRRTQADTSPGGPSGSSFLRQKVRSVVALLTRADRPAIDDGLPALRASRAAVMHDWEHKASALEQQGEAALAGSVREFARSFPEVMTDNRRIAAAIGRAERAGRGPDNGQGQPGRAGKAPGERSR